ncbi:hypothetical protein ACFFSW_21365 [Saccharothrix longispora]|uniref:Uncharacterized protein n=1 Tax=Saccharothrix longispora TaxID=33920 RepID=A0ABU1Q676_9PSEU|nr:hypothetical protein [Saccharothrix longispora]MDR6598390.1 hypothetical protein [Saccharothrix longispora]
MDVDGGDLTGVADELSRQGGVVAGNGRQDAVAGSGAKLAERRGPTAGAEVQLAGLLLGSPGLMAMDLLAQAFCTVASGTGKWRAHGTRRVPVGGQSNRFFGHRGVARLRRPITL